MKRGLVLKLALSLALIVAISVVLVQEFGNRSSGPPGYSSDSDSTHAIAVDDVTSSAPTSCGSWATSSTDPTQESITTTYGPIQSCQLIGYTWVLIAHGISDPPSDSSNDPSPEGATWTQSGVIATYPCSPSSSTCLSPSGPHPISDWTVTAFPNDGFLTVIAFPGPFGLQVQINSAQWYFDLATATFSAEQPTLLFSECWQAWDQTLAASGVSPSSATTVTQQQFLASSPQCANP
jgi:hypothetical protein